MSFAVFVFSAGVFSTGLFVLFDGCSWVLFSWSFWALRALGCGNTRVLFRFLLWYFLLKYLRKWSCYGRALLIDDCDGCSGCRAPSRDVGCVGCSKCVGSICIVIKLVSPGSF